MRIYKKAFETWEELGNKGYQYPVPKRNQKVKTPSINNWEESKWTSNSPAQGNEYSTGEEHFIPTPPKETALYTEPPIYFNPSLEQMDLQIQEYNNKAWGIKFNGKTICITSREGALGIKVLFDKMKDEILKERSKNMPTVEETEQLKTI